MKKKLNILLIFLFIIIFPQQNYSEITIKILASVNERIITNIDLNNEIKLLKISQTPNNNLGSPELNKVALNNLIEIYLKEIEIKKNNTKISQSLIEQYYLQTLQSIEKNNEKKILDKSLKNILYNKIKVSLEWNQLITNIYSWKLSVNMEEINYKISKIKKNNKDIEEIKKQLIEQEKLKKIIIFSNYHLKKIKNDTFIKFY